MPWVSAIGGAATPNPITVNSAGCTDGERHRVSLLALAVFNL